MIADLRLVVVLTAAGLLILVALPFQLIGLIGVKPLARHVPVYFHRALAWLFGVRISVEGNLTLDRPLLLVANHMSWLDIVVLSTLRPVSFVAKADMRSWPLFGQLAQLQRTIFIERDRRRTAGVQVNEIANRLIAGDVIVLFPEGTTSDGHDILPFKTPLFEAARFALMEGEIDTAQVQPVALDYTHLHGMPLGRQWLQHVAWPGDIGLGENLIPLVRTGALDVTLRLAEPITMTAASNRKEVARETRDSLRRSLDRNISTDIEDMA